MLWNATGIIRSFTSEDENSIDVEFHDAAIHHPIHLGNSNGFTMADLSTEAILLASEGEDDVPAKLTCHYFATSALVKEWTMEMPEKEGILAICCGIGWVSFSFKKFVKSIVLIICIKSLNDNIRIQKTHDSRFLLALHILNIHMYPKRLVSRIFIFSGGCCDGSKESENLFSWWNAT